MVQPFDYRICEIPEQRRRGISSRERICSCCMAMFRPLGISRGEALALFGIVSGSGGGEIGSCGIGGIGCGAVGCSLDAMVAGAFCPCVLETFAQLDGEMLVMVQKSPGGIEGKGTDISVAGPLAGS